ncbi:MAG: type II toxin-antitoxin system HicA family toxin [Hyphomicrobiales bacterium]|nr:type II toxin-antitoxin system HicA family toxin [Hyphomicrobiales bacterium]
MNSKQKKTLNAVFSKPAPRSLEWKDIENLLIACGAELIEGRGSRIRFTKYGVVAFFHRPHPAKEAKQYQVRDAREFLEKIGETP